MESGGTRAEVHPQAVVLSLGRSTAKGPRALRAFLIFYSHVRPQVLLCVKYITLLSSPFSIIPPLNQPNNLEIHNGND